MKTSLSLLTFALAALLGCSSTEAETTSGGTTTDTTTGTAGSVQDVRGDRYCEILIGTLEGTTVHVEVWNTYLLNDCPDEAWKALDAGAIKSEAEADVVILNGPRYWTMDRFEGSKVVDTTVETFGGIEMRVAGTLDLPLAEVMGGESAYSPRKVERTTMWVYEAGKSVYELIDPEGNIYDMQSYSVQEVAQTEESLAGLGQELTLPEGWTFQSRVLDAELSVTAVDGVATVVQDERGNTYQLSQQ